MYPYLPGCPCPYSIASLVQRCADGDVAALGSLFDRVLALVDGEVARHDPSGGHDDTVLRVFARIWREAPTFAACPEPVLAWIGQRVRDECDATAPAGRASADRLLATP